MIGGKRAPTAVDQLAGEFRATRADPEPLVPLGSRWSSLPYHRPHAERHDAAGHGAYIGGSRTEKAASLDEKGRVVPVARSVTALLLLALLASCGTAAAPSSVSSAKPLSTPTVATSPSNTLGLVGTWRRDQSCQETAQLFESLGLKTLGADYITNNGFRSESAAVVAADSDMCRGASGPKARTITFRADGHWTGTSEGQQVDDGTYVPGDLSFVLPGDPAEGSPTLTILYRVEGDTAKFTVEAPQPCTDQACIEQVAWAKETFQLGAWTRG